MSLRVAMITNVFINYNLISNSNRCHKIIKLRRLCHSSKVRVRFAPSPTGHLHLGGLRTALYNFLLAKSSGGSFILRIEDTDQTRLVPGATEKLYEILNWVGLPPDEGPFIGGNFCPYLQSQRLPIYQEYVQKLLENGTAYRCFCSERRLDLMRKDAEKRGQMPKYDNRCRSLSLEAAREKLDKNIPYVIRFKLNPFPNGFDDLVFGIITHDPSEIEGDPIIMKSDGYPTYHFANVVDDHLMEITHVLRGVEWQISTPKHILMYEAFGWIPPKFAHLPLILNSDGTKLSKRQGDLHVEYFKNKGYFPESLLNFVTLIGGGFESTQWPHIYSLSEIVDRFSLNKVNINSCRLDFIKLEECNKMAIKHRLESVSQTKDMVATLRQLILDKFESRLGEAARSNLTDENIEKMLHLFKTRITNLDQLATDEFEFVWILPDRLNEATFDHDDMLNIIQMLLSIPDEFFHKERVNEALRNYAQRKSVKYGTLMKFLRSAISNQTKGPSVAEMLEVLGKDAAVQRLHHAQTLVINAMLNK